MKTQKNYRHQIHAGDSCKIDPELSYEEHLIEDHPQKLIEDHPQHLIEDHPQKLIGGHHEEEVAAAAAAVGAPVAGGRSSHWWAWCVAGLVGLFIIGLGMYYGLRNSHDKVEGAEYASVSGAGANGNVAAGSVKTTGNSGVAAAERVEDYVYYFGNDQSGVTDNDNLEQMADKIENSGADVVVIAYASQVGNEAYNKALSEKRANNIASYLIAHGVPGNHVKVVSNGETTNYGDDAHNRRANIHVVYPS